MDNLVSLWEDAARQYADNTYIGMRSPSGTYQWVTYRDVNERINNLRAGLSQARNRPWRCQGNHYQQPPGMGHCDSEQYHENRFQKCQIRCCHALWWFRKRQRLFVAENG